MSFTKQQSEAIYTHDQNLIVVAGAGSGKTRVLVERYIALLDANPDWPLNALVAITFTKKAAGEMRDRVRQALEKRLYSATTPDAVERWSALLAQIDSARIDTIHAFCSDLLRTNAAEAEIDPDFEVLDEIEGAMLLDDVIDSVLARLNTDGDPAVELITEYDTVRVREVLRDESLLYADHDITTMPEALMQGWQEAWQRAILKQVGHLRNRYDEIGSFEPAAGDKIGDQWRICLDAVERLHSGNPDTLINALNEINDIKLTGGSYKNWGSKETLQEAKDALKQIRTAAKDTLDMIGEQPGPADERAAHLLPLWGSLLRRVREAFDAAKSRRGLLDFNDLERLTADLLAHHPAVRARYQNAEFKHLLVDEFQDTNAAQWQIVQGLADLHTPGSVFVVGDQKQSIYAFRGADVSVFGQVRGQIEDHGHALMLSTSFRTHKPLLDAFNDLFGRLLVPEENSPVRAYQVALDTPLEAYRQNPPSAAPPVEMLIIDQYEHDEDGQPFTGKDGKPAKINADDRRAWEAAEIAARIHAMVAEERPVYDKELNATRPMRYDDVTILFQSLTRVTLYEEAFKAADLPFITVAGRGYYDRQEVWDLQALLSAVYDPADNLSLATALRSPMFGLSDDALLALRLQTAEDDHKPLPLWEALAAPGDLLPADERDKAAFAHDCLAHLNQIAGRVTVAELLRVALEQTGYLAVLSGLPDGPRRRGNVEKLLEKAQSGGQITLGAFSRYLQDLSEREAREGEAVVDVSGVVTIMSVHASKGLEFPVVVLADASWERSGSSSATVITAQDGSLACRVYDFDEDKHVAPFCYQQADDFHRGREAAERLRLLYVAATRAQDYLLISGRAQQNKNSDEWKASGWLKLIIGALDLQEAFDPAAVQTISQSWGNLRITAPAQRPDDLTQTTSETPTTGWDGTPPAEISPVMPDLLADIATYPEAQARHLSATHIADLGSAEHVETRDEQRFYRDRFRRQILQDAPATVEQVSHPRRRVSARQVGEMVHEALRYERIMRMAGDELKEVLVSYAWRQGITDYADCREAANRAYQLLTRYKKSRLHHDIVQSPAVYRELPFIYERQGYIIHGIIDVLFRTPQGQWIIVDYKTSRVDGEGVESMVSHARRYHLQLAVYAEAVQAQFATPPGTYIHYLRYNHTVQVTEDEWRGALERSLTERILEVIDS